MSIEIKSIRDLKLLLQFHDCFGPGAEIGVAEGRNSLFFLQLGIPALFMVDNWATIENQKGDGGFPMEWHEKNYTDAKERVKEFGNKAIFLKGKSTDQAQKIKDEQLDWIFIDANHSFDGCMEDLKAWMPKVKKNGLVIGHDFLNPAYGVYDAVHDFCKEQYIIHTIPEDDPVNACFWFQKI